MSCPIFFAFSLLRTEAKQNNSVVEHYEYDANGNRTLETKAFRGTSNTSYSHSPEDHVLTAGADTYQFDADGFLTARITSAGTTTFAYSARGELLGATLPDGKVISYDHDPMGRRIAKRVNGTIIEKYLWQSQTRLLAVYDGSNNLIMRFTYADGRMPVSMTKDGVTYYLFIDQLGSLRAVVDGNGQIIKELVYDSFGYLYNESNLSFTIPFCFAGGLHDRDTGLIRFGLRDYDPTIGRWTAKDLIDFAGGDVNLFGYVGNNPVNWIDPFGLLPPGMVPQWLINNAQIAVNNVTNNAFSQADLAQLTDMVISTVSVNPFATANLNDALKLGSLDPYDNPLTLSERQAQAVNNIFKSLEKDALTDAQKELLRHAEEAYEMAKENGSCKIK